jgi:AAA lid domain-containing protein/ATPase family protein associated with various cellular activities (AAA)
LNGTPRLDINCEQEMGGLAGFPGLEAVCEQLAGPIAVLRAEQARRKAGATVTRAAWKNLIFTGGPGTGKTRAARAVGRIYAELGLLSGDLREIAAADLVGTTLQETGALVDATVWRGSGDLLMINDAHAWYGLPDHGRHVLRCLYKELTILRDHSPNHSSGLAVILAGSEGPLRSMLAANSALAARFPAAINFPGYTAGHLAAIFATMAGEAGFTLTSDAARKAAAVLAEAGHDSGNARLAVRLLDQVTVSQARRITAVPQPPDPATLSTIDATDIPAHVHADDPPTDNWPGQYL